MMIALFMTMSVIMALICFFLAVRILFFESGEITNAETRQRMFELRDDLFQLGEDGTIPFDSVSHERLRSSINCVIRFAHELNIASLIAGRLIMARRVDVISQKEFEVNLLGDLSGDSRKAGEDIIKQMTYWMTVHVIKESWIVMTTIGVTFLLYVLPRSLVGRVKMGSVVAKSSAQETAHSVESKSQHPWADVCTNQPELRKYLKAKVVPKVDRARLFGAMEERVLRACPA